MSEYYFYIKALHIIFIVTWFAGLFYAVRLFIYHSETKSKDSPEKEILQKQYKIMTKRLWTIIAWPSAIITLITATLLIIAYGMDILSQGWMQIKLFFVLLLYLYQIICHRIYKQLQKDIIKYSSNQLRLWNEVATIILFSIVFLVVLKSTFSWVFGVAGIIGLMILLMLGIKIYKKLRGRKK